MKQLCACVIGTWLAAALPAAGAPPPLRGFGVDETLDRAAILAPALDRVQLSGLDLPVFVRLILRPADLGAAPADFSPLDERINLYSRRNVPVVLALVDPPTGVAEIDAWRATLRLLAEHCRGKVLAYQVGDRLGGAAGPTPRDYAYLVKFVAVQVRSIDSAALIIEGSLTPDGAAEWQAQIYREDAAAYLDAVALSAPPTDDDRTATEMALTALDGLAAKEDPSAMLGLTGLVLPGDGRRAAERLMGWYLPHLGGRSTFTTCVTSVEALASVLRAAVTVKDVVAGEIVTLEDVASSLKLTLKGQDVTATLPHRLLYNMTTFATYLVYWAPGGTGETLEVNLHLASAGTPVVRDAAGATTVKLRDATRDEASKTSTARVELSDRPLLLDFNFGAEEVFALRSEAAERALPTVDEIIFRHQQAETAQAARVRNYVANARIDIHFQPTPLDSYDVVTENRFFSDTETVEWEELSFSLNGTRWGRDRPPFPLLQPEKVLSLPLALRLNRDYVYHFVGLDRVNDRPCYVVAFDPIDQAKSLYRGKVWIDTERYVRLKVQALQTGLAAPMVSNEEVQAYEPVARLNDQPVYLFSRLTSRQIMLIAGRNLLVEKQVVFSDFRVNDEQFADARQQARRGDNIMYRDTDLGLRYLIKRGDERVVSDQTTTSGKALAFGVTLDPSYDYPVPLAGIDYVNFNFLNRGLQFGFIFSGVLAAGNLQKAKIAGTKFDLSVDFFGIAVTNNDQVYDDNGERKGERLESRPVSTGVNLGYQLSDFQKITLSSHVQYDAFRTSRDNTETGFAVPVSTATVNGAINYEYRRAGYSFLGSYAHYRRARWERWGHGVDFDPAAQSYTKYNLGISKDFYFKTFNKIHLNVAYYGGQREDRFSMYRFGLFDETRMRGVPSAGVRFSELGMARASYSFNLLNLYRLAVYMDRAWGRTPSSSVWQSTTGTGFEVNFRGPKTTMLKLGVGKGFLPKIYRGSGSVVVEFMVFKPI
jgi:hypothetical protein